MKQPEINFECMPTTLLERVEAFVRRYHCCFIAALVGTIIGLIAG